MNIIDSKNRPIEIPYSYYVLVILDSLYKEKTRKPHDVLLRWQNEFLQIGIPIVLLSNDPKYKVGHSYIHYVYCVDKSAYESFDRFQRKIVFGKEKDIVVPGIFVIDENNVEKALNRVNDKSVAQVYMYVLKGWVQKKLKKIKKIIDKGSRVC